jgi:hydroxymethylpyrimidine/phosphomethylpyrimidine kinase
LITPEAIEALKTHLLPLATVITPNLPEAEVLTGMTIQTSQEAEVAAKTLAEAYHASIILKGGHFAGDAAEDLLYDCETQQVHRLSAPRIQNPISTHGTGCTFAAALTAELALGHNIVQAAVGAKKQVYAAISSAMWVGPDCGVLGFVQ